MVVVVSYRDPIGFLIAACRHSQDPGDRGALLSRVLLREGFGTENEQGTS